MNAPCSLRRILRRNFNWGSYPHSAVIIGVYLAAVYWAPSTCLDSAWATMTNPTSLPAAGLGRAERWGTRDTREQPPWRRLVLPQKCEDRQPRNSSAAVERSAKWNHAVSPPRAVQARRRALRWEVAGWRHPSPLSPPHREVLESFGPLSFSSRINLVTIVTPNFWVVDSFSWQMYFVHNIKLVKNIWVYPCPNTYFKFCWVIHKNVMFETVPSFFFLFSHWKGKMPISK